MSGTGLGDGLRLRGGTETGLPERGQLRLLAGLRTLGRRRGRGGEQVDEGVLTGAGTDRAAVEQALGGLPVNPAESVVPPKTRM